MYNVRDRVQVNRGADLGRIDNIVRVRYSELDDKNEYYLDDSAIFYWEHELDPISLVTDDGLRVGDKVRIEETNEVDKVVEIIHMGGSEGLIYLEKQETKDEPYYWTYELEKINNGENEMYMSDLFAFYSDPKNTNKRFENVETGNIIYFNNGQIKIDDRCITSYYWSDEMFKIKVKRARKIKKMTQEEIERELGYKIEIDLDN